MLSCCIFLESHSNCVNYIIYEQENQLKLFSSSQKKDKSYTDEVICFNMQLAFVVVFKYFSLEMLIGDFKS